jgi:hypothetical protein
LRISWRLALLILVLRYSRARRASLAKLHLLNDTLRSDGGRKRLSSILASSQVPPEWPFRVEPALGRAIDMARGEGLVKTEDGATYQLTESGLRAAESLRANEGVLQEERSFLESQSSKITEHFVNTITHTLSL